MLAENEIWNDAVSAHPMAIDDLARLPPGQGALYAILAVDNLVATDGLYDALVTDGDLFPAAIAGFRLFGLPQVADLLERILAVVGSPLPSDRAERERVLDGLGDAVDEPFEALASDYWRIAHSSDRPITLAFRRYLVEHPDEFADPILVRLIAP